MSPPSSLPLAVAVLGVPLLVAAVHLRTIAARPVPAAPVGCGGCACGAGGCGADVPRLPVRAGTGIGVLFAFTLPGLVVLLVAVATVEHGGARLGRRSPVYRRERHALSAGGMDVFSAALFPGKAVDLQERRVRQMIRDFVDDGAPPYGRIDLDSGVAYLDPR